MHNTIHETIGICVDALYSGHLNCPPFSEDTLKGLMLIAIGGVEFSFNSQMYRQLDGVAMAILCAPNTPKVLIERFINVTLLN